MAIGEHDIAIATFSEPDADGFVGVQVDAYGPDAGGPPIELHSPYGFYSRPLDPDADGTGCQVLTAYEGSRQHAWLSTDPRAIPKLPPIEGGGSVMYSAAGNFVRCKTDGSVSLFTTADNTTNGASVFFQARPDGFTQLAPWGKSTFDKAGYHVLTQSGARLDIGGMGGLPAPLSALGSYANLSAASITLEASMVTLGPAAGLAFPVAIATPLLAWMDALDAFLAVLAAGAGSAPLGGGVSAGLTTYTTAALLTRGLIASKSVSAT